jgi:transglutaminase-like putative cysteine protease
MTGKETFPTAFHYKTMKKVSACYIIVFLCGILIWATPAQGKGDSNAAIDLSTLQYSLPREVQYGFTLQNKTNRLLEEAEFWTYAPVKKTAAQQVIKLETSHPYKLITDDLGNQILYFEFQNLPPFSTKIIKIKAFLELFSIPNKVAIHDLQPFLQPEKYIESDNPELIGFANKFMSAGPVNTAKNIFRWVADNVEYTGYLKDNHGALYAFKNRKGDCTEYMSLFVALARANNVPSRGIGGYITTANAILKPYEYHNWAEFYDDGVWKIADPQNKVFMQDQSHYIAMRIIGESDNNPMGDFDRYRYAGDGLNVKMNK